jgi:DNA-binding LacI/PurR family transcriptional regulator
MLTGPLSYKATRDRIRGYENILSSARIPYDETLIIEADWTYDGGYTAMHHLLDRGVEFTAIFAQSDEIAIGAMQALREANFRIPQDVSIVAYNDNPVAAYFNPSITTVRQPMREVGKVGIQILLRAIKGEPLEQGEFLLKPQLIKRASAIPLV